MFASQVRKTVQVNDGDTVVNVVLRKLSGASLEKASEARQLSIATMTSHLGPEVVEQYQREREAKEAQRKAGTLEEEKKDPKDRHVSYSRQSVLHAGVHDWDLKDEKGRSVRVTPDRIDDLDEPTADFLFHEILELSLPPEAAKKEEEAKND